MRAVSRQVDVVVIGGGPAGSATALLLRKAGFSTLILNPPRKYSPLGETLPAAAAPILRYLGVWNRFCEQEAPRLDGLASAWGGSSLECRDLFSTPGGSGWILERQPFNQMLLHHCTQVGTLVVPQAATHIERLARSQPAVCQSVLELLPADKTARFPANN
jgi:2-polyprenyl-6-methoxyphenol hydroxylase-like FAD-dependent oxidoreductase